jgi:glyoxylase-like metal-dependent hydrolase (beta-lactamase superfamily II)
VTDVARRPGDPDGAPRPKKPRKQEQEPAREDVVEVAPDILRMQLPIWMPGLGHVNMYGLVDDRGLAVVDPGLPGPKSWKALKSRLKTAGFKLRDIHTVVVTHSHPDHFGGAGRIAREARAGLIAHRAFTTWSLDRKLRKRQARLSEQEAEELELQAGAVAETVDVSPDEIPTVAEVGDRDTGDPLLDDPTVERQRQSVPWGGETPWGGTRHPMPPLRRRVMIRALSMLFTPPDPTRRVRHGEPVKLAGREWTALHTPGHTLDHLCLYDEEHGILIAGDHVLPSITPHVSGVGNGADALRSYIATLELVADLPGVRLGLPAHGHPFDDVPGRVEAIKRHHHERMELLRAASTSLGPANVHQLSREVFPRKHWGVMAESETFAHLEHLVLAGQAERHREHGRLIYTVAPAS